MKIKNLLRIDPKFPDTLVNYRLFFDKSGGGNRTFVLLHGQVSTHRYMSQLAMELAKKGTVYNFDLLGFGNSPRPKENNYTPEDHTTALYNSLKELKLKNIELVGHSMGAIIGLETSYKYPELIKQLYLTSLPQFGDKPYKQLAEEFPGSKPILRGISGLVFCKISAIAPKLIAKLIQKSSPQELSNLPAFIFEDSLRHSWRSYNLSMKNTLFAYDSHTSLKKLKTPVKLFFGKKDTITRGFKDNLVSIVKKDEIIVFNAHHNLPLTHHKEIASYIK